MPSLSIMVGGAADDFDAARPILDAVGKTVVHVGPAGSGQTVKAANQLMVAGIIELVAEAIVFLEAYGVDTEAGADACWAAAWPAARCSPARARPCWPATSSRAFGSRCTTRTWASSPRPPARPASRSRSAPSSRS